MKRGRSKPYSPPAAHSTAHHTSRRPLGWSMAWEGVFRIKESYGTHRQGRQGESGGPVDVGEREGRSNEKHEGTRGLGSYSR